MRNQGENPHQPGRLGAGVKTAYAVYRDWMDKAGIASLSIPNLKDTYTHPCVLSILLIMVAAYSVHTASPVGDIPIPLLFGFLSRDQMERQRWAILGRVSSKSQSNNSSTETQIEEIKDECKEADGTVEYKYELAESGASIDRESLEEIVAKGEKDEIDILGVSKFDRLMRADPWQAIKYLRRLKQADVTLYVGTHGYFDYEDMFDFRILIQQVLFAREWYNRVRTNSTDGQVSKLQKGKWPFGNILYGYGKREDGEIYIKDKKEQVLSAIFEEYKNKENLEKVHDSITERFDIEDLPDEASDVGRILNNRICVGDLMHKSTVVCRDPDLAVVDRETFQNVQEIRHEQSHTSGSAREIPEAVNRAAADFDPLYVLDLIDSLGPQCRKCGSDLRKYGTEDRWGIKTQKYKCKNDDCGYQGPLLTKNELEKLNGTLPVKCPYCPATERFNVTRGSNADFAWEFTYECQNCGKSFGSNEVEGIYERAKENPHLQFDWYEDNRGIVAQKSTEESTQSDCNSEESGSEENSTLGDFAH